MPIDRRSMLLGAAAIPMAGKALADMPRIARADDEAGWAQIAALYDKPRDVVQLENAYWGVMARPVQAVYAEKLAFVNRQSSYYARRQWYADMNAVRARVAAQLGVGADEIMLTRNATEALKALIGNYAGLRAGDAVMFADLDYDSMQASMTRVAERRGLDLIRLSIPEPASHQGLIDFYEAALRAHPKTRLLLLTHLSHRTGLVPPVREIVAMARTHGVDCIVDAAHSWGQLDFTLPDLGADFVGLNLHKWQGAPLGAGILYIRKARMGDIEPDIAAEGVEEDSIDARVHTGTLDFACHLTVPAALDFQQRIGGKAKEARLRHLRGLWAEELRDLDGLEVLTPADPRLHCGITSFRIRGCAATQDNVDLAGRLLSEHRVMTVHRPGVAKGACIRVTPGVFTTPDEVQALVDALKTLVPQLKRG